MTIKLHYKYYKPSIISLLTDFFIFIIGFFVVIEWLPLTTNTPYEKYTGAAVFYYLIWVLISYYLGRYRPLHKLKYINQTLHLFYVSILSFGIAWFLSFLFFDGYYSVYIIFTYTSFIVGITFIFYLIYFMLLYAVEYEDEPIKILEREAAYLKPAPPLDNVSYETLCKTLAVHSCQKALEFLSNQADLRSGNTYVNFSTSFFDVNAKPNYIYSTIINLEKLNNIRNINKLFTVVNQKLPDDGRFVCCFESKSTRKKRILNSLPFGINYIYYSINYIYRRLMPKVFFSRRLYYDFTQGKNRILTKAEVFGRLYFCGFEVLVDKKIGELHYVYARRIQQPKPTTKKSYGPLIKLRRVGKNGKIFDVYKIRTMHSYSEYLQAYVYDHYDLQEGGKFNNDIRISTLGRIMRKYFLDELPMLLNLLKGDMKIVGVRPLSNHYFNLYSKELQEKRVKFKPGLLPPFYADMPQTLEEIQDSEMKYLTQCEEKGTFLTDFCYFFKILKNIFVKRARSA